MRKVALIVAVLIIVLAFNTSALAANPQYYDKGRAQTTVLNNTNISKSIMVISAGANYDPGTGREKIRVWSRRQNVIDYYNGLWSGTGYYVGSTEVIRADLRLYSDDSKRSALWIQTGSVYPTATSSSTLLSQVIWDILSYLGVPTNTIQAITNAFTVESISQASATQSSGPYYDWTVSFKNNAGLNKNIVDLPTSVSYSDADGWSNGQTRSISAEYLYSLPSNQTPFTFWPQAQICYAVDKTQYPSGTVYPFAVWSGAAGVRHTVG